MQAPTHHASTAHTHHAASAANTTALRELSQIELLAVSGGSPKGGWITPSVAPTGATEMSSPKGGW